MLPKVNSKTFCVGPWTEVRINSDGSLNFCHAASRAGISQQESIQNMDVSLYFSQAASATQARNLILQGQQVDACKNCYHNDELGVVSFRQRRNLQYGIFPKEDFELSAHQSSFWHDIAKSNLKPRFYHVSFSNICNMSCMMCNSQDSSLFAATQHRAFGTTAIQPISTDWTQGPAWDQFCNHILSNDQIVCIHVMGGEPLYHKRFREFLAMLTHHQHTNFHFTFVTNGSLFDPELIDLLRNFQSVVVEISIETTTPANDYIRRFAQPTQHILNNIDKWCQCRDENFSVVLRSVPQALSVLDYDKLLDYAAQRQLIVDSNWLQNPAFLKSNILPQQIKSIVAQRLQKFLNNKPDVADINLRDQSRINANLQRNAQAVIDQMNSACVDHEQHRKDLVQWCASFDRERGIHARDYVPELLEFLNNYNYEILNSDLP